MDLGFLVQMYPQNTFGGLKRPQNRPKSVQIDIEIQQDAFFYGSWYSFTYIAYIYQGPWDLGLNVPLEHLYNTSGGLKRASKQAYYKSKLQCTSTRMLKWVFYGYIWTKNPRSIINIGYVGKQIPRSTQRSILVGVYLNL